MKKREHGSAFLPPRRHPEARRGCIPGFKARKAPQVILADLGTAPGVSCAEPDKLRLLGDQEETARKGPPRGLEVQRRANSHIALKQNAIL